jgi:hypothetical protein
MVRHGKKGRHRRPSFGLFVAGASIAIDGGVDATPSGGGNDAEVDATVDTESDVTATDAMTTFDGTAADAAPDAGLVCTRCPGSSTCTSGTVAGPDSLP